MGNAQPAGSGASLPTYSRSRQSSMSENGIPIPSSSQLPKDLEQEISNSLSSYNNLAVHRKSSGPNSGLDAIISPGYQYRSRYRAGSVSIDHDAPPTNMFVQPLPAVIKWDKGGHEVSISGSFNNWERKIPLVQSSNNFYTIINLHEGEHQYMFYVDGEPKINVDEPTVTNSCGATHNLVTVRKKDLEIFDALEKDQQSKSRKTSEVGDYPQDEYGQYIPDRKLKNNHVGPPVLPQQLTKVLLNQDIPQHLEPGILPEPNHVMLNHMYALSIKDGVMVLSDTSRFRKKYVTTLLYKPIE